LRQLLIHGSTCKKFLGSIIESNSIFQKWAIGPTSTFCNFTKLSYFSLGYFILQQFNTCSVSPFISFPKASQL
jgi:hypothetical protein